MRRFLIQAIKPGQQTTALDHDQSRHVRKVLRLQEGAEIELFDGMGMIYEAVISALDRRVTVRIKAGRYCAAPSPRLHLHLGLLKGKKMEFVIQKATELGAHSMTPFLSDFIDARPPKEEKVERWRKISLEACKQCGRSWPLTINNATPLADQLASLADHAVGLLFWENEEKRDMAGVAAPTWTGSSDIHLFLGPEGGFSQTEVDLCREKMTAVSLGPLTLRAETAAITALSLTLFLAGRMRHK